jgi:hypothetical protein
MTRLSHNTTILLKCQSVMLNHLPERNSYVSVVRVIVGGVEVVYRSGSDMHEKLYRLECFSIRNHIIRMIANIVFR